MANTRMMMELRWMRSAGVTLEQFAADYKTTVNQLKAWNNLGNPPYNNVVGDPLLKVYYDVTPSPSTPPTPTPSNVQKNMSVTGGYIKDSAVLSGNSYVIFKHLGNKKYVLPTFPEEPSRNVQAVFPETPILGRSAPYYTYSNTQAQAMQVAFTLHTDMIPDNRYIYQLANAFKSACYPVYASNIIKPPSISIKIGNLYFANAIVTSYNERWLKPLIDNRYSGVDISLSIIEVVDKALSAPDIEGGTF